MKFRDAIVVIPIVVLCMLTSTAVTYAETFHSEKYGYQLDVPSDWKSIPDEVIKQYVAAIQKQSSDVKLIYDAGFQLESAEHWFTYPYILVQVMPYETFGLDRQMNQDEFPNFIQSVTGMDLSKVTKDHMSDEVQGLLGNIQTRQIQLDSENQRYSWQVNMEAQGVGTVRGMVSGFFGREAIIQVTCYTLESDWDQFEPARKQITDSFRFDDAKAYSPQLAAEHQSSFWKRAFSGSFSGALIGGVVGAIVAALAAVNKKKSAKNAEDNSPNQEG